MPRVQIHCYGCDATVSVATASSTEDLSRAGWSLVHGETYCPKCAPARVSSLLVSAGEGDDTKASPTPLDDDATATAVASSEHSSTATLSGIQRLAKWSIPAGVSPSSVRRVKWTRFGRTGEREAERRLALLRPAATALMTTLQLPFRRSNGPVTSHSKVSSQTIALFCIAAVLTLATLGSSDLAIRLPGVLCAFAAGLSWLRDLRNRS